MGIYGVVIQQGANLVRMDMRTTLIALLWGALELAVTYAGCRIGKWLLLFETERHHSVFWVHLLAGLILACIGVRMLFKAFRKKTFLEHRMEQLDVREDGIRKMAEIYRENIKALDDSLMDIKDAAGTYKTFSGALDSTDNNVKFIIKTDSIELDED